MSAFCKLVKEEKRRVQREICKNLLAGKIGTIRHFVFSISLCVYLLSIYLCAVLFDLCASTGGREGGCPLPGAVFFHLIFQAGAFSFHFFVKHVTQILAELPQRRPCKHFPLLLLLLPLPLPLPLYGSVTVTIAGRKCNAISHDVSVSVGDSVNVMSTCDAVSLALCPAHCPRLQSRPVQ